MVGPLLLAGLAGGAGILSGIGLSSIFGGGSTKKEATQAVQQGTTIAPYGIYAPSSSQQYSPQYSYQVQIQSPGASASTTKKDTLTSEQYPNIPLSVSQVPSQAQSDTKTTDWTTLMIIAATGFIVYGVVTKK